MAVLFGVLPQPSPLSWLGGEKKEQEQKNINKKKMNKRK